MKLNFSNGYYKQQADIIMKSENTKSDLSNEDAFLLLIEGLDDEELSNLIFLISYKNNLTYDEAIDLIKNPISKKDKVVIFRYALELVNNRIPLGEKVNSEGRNTSLWINHCVNEAIVSQRLATMLHLDPTFAFNYGLLHDIGRKFSQDFDHVTKGFEYLVSKGYKTEAKSCLTHSFINAGRQCNNELIENDFYVDEDNIEHSSFNDDVKEVLNGSKYTMFDHIVNIADLVAGSYGILTPIDRIQDIQTRRPELSNSLNRKYFLASFYNLMLDFLNKVNFENDLTYIDFHNLSLDEINNHLEIISDIFYNTCLSESTETFYNKKYL